MREEIRLDTNEDILYQIAMDVYNKYNDQIATINDHLGEIYGYSDLKDVEDAEKEYEKMLLEKAIIQLQKENKELKDNYNQLEEWLKEVLYTNDEQSRNSIFAQGKCSAYINALNKMQEIEKGSDDSEKDSSI